MKRPKAKTAKQKGKKMWYKKPNYLLSTIAWINWFVLSWLLLFGILSGTTGIVLWFWFLFIAVAPMSKRRDAQAKK